MSTLASGTKIQKLRVDFVSNNRPCGRLQWHLGKWPHSVVRSKAWLKDEVRHRASPFGLRRGFSSWEPASLSFQEGAKPLEWFRDKQNPFCVVSERNLWNVSRRKQNLLRAEVMLIYVLMLILGYNADDSRVWKTPEFAWQQLWLVIFIEKFCWESLSPLICY